MRVFALVKAHLRSHITYDDFLIEIGRGFAALTKEALRNFYRHCIDYLFVHGIHIPPGSV